MEHAQVNYHKLIFPICLARLEVIVQCDIATRGLGYVFTTTRLLDFGGEVEGE